MDTENIILPPIAPDVAPDSATSRVSQILRSGKENDDFSSLPRITPLLCDKTDNENRAVKMGKIEENKYTYIENNRERRGARGAIGAVNAVLGVKNGDLKGGKEGGQSEQRGAIANSPDSRLKDPLFAASVRTVLEYLGIENTRGNFRRYDSKYGGVIRDWLAFAERISSPRMTAEVAVKGGRNTLSFCVDLPGRSRAEAIKKLDTDCYEFRRWI
jgi:hypothetical protein